MIHLHQISKHFGEQVLYRKGNLSILSGDRIGLVGPNGSGKTTLFRVITGQDGVDGGEVSFSDRIVIGYFSQDVAEMAGRSVLEEVMSGAGRVSQLASEMKTIEDQLEQAALHPLSDEKMTSLLERYGEVQLEFQQRGGYDLESRARTILTGLSFSLEEQGRPVESYSGGWKMRIELAKILVLNPELLLMDEPTNHLDVESIMWLEEWLLNYSGALMMTSHDRDFMNRLVNRCVAVENQTLVHYQGNYDFYEREKEVRRSLLVASYEKQQDLFEKEEAFINRFGAKASYASRVQSRVKKLDKIERIEIPAEEAVAEFRFPVAPRSGNDVLKIVHLGHSWKGPDAPKDQWVFRGFQNVVKRGDRVAVVGVNGAGKSTLLKCLAHQIVPTEGEVQVGAQVQVGYFSQSAVEILHLEKTLLEEMQDRFPECSLGWIRKILGVFLFSGDAVYKKIRSLSGGEKSRLVLATLLASPLNLLVLDEPTNHLDIKTREMLVRAIQEFEGTLLVVSHDRHFLKAITNRVFAVSQGKVKVYEGSYGDYLASQAASTF